MDKDEPIVLELLQMETNSVLATRQAMEETRVANETKLAWMDLPDAIEKHFVEYIDAVILCTYNPALATFNAEERWNFLEAAVQAYNYALYLAVTEIQYYQTGAFLDQLGKLDAKYPELSPRKQCEQQIFEMKVGFAEKVARLGYLELR